MKKIILLSLLVLLPFSMIGCKKDNKKNNPPQSEKTVDLGENAKEDADDVKKDEDKPNVRKDHKRELPPKKPKINKNDNAPKDDVAPKKDENDKKEKKDELAENPPKDDAIKPDNKADNPAEGIDFANDDDIPKAPEMRPPRPKSSLSIEKLINIRELREQTGYSGTFAEAWLPGQVLDARYNAMRLSTDNENRLGFAIQVWKPGNESAASKRFNDLFNQSFGGQKIKDVATDAFTASHHKINELGFFEKSKRATVMLSCSDDVCTVDQLKSIAQIIQRRL